MFRFLVYILVLISLFLPTLDLEAKELNKEYSNVIIPFPIIDKGVYYHLDVYDEKGKILYKSPKIYASGFDLSLENMEKGKDYTISAYDIEDRKIYSGEKIPLFSGTILDKNWHFIENFQNGKIGGNTLVKKATLLNKIALTDNYKEDDIFPLYPVFAWIKERNSDEYTILVEKETAFGKFQLIDKIDVGDTYDYYSEKNYKEEGLYRYKVMGKKGDKKNGESPYFYFKRESIYPIVALGDSITHGGGAISTPAGSNIYNYLFYLDFKVLNAGYSGNTTKNMLDRIDDVLEYKPKIVLIMGGINDLRQGIKGDTVIANLEAIEEKVKNIGATPVFISIIPLNEEETTKHIKAPSPNWKQELQKVNEYLRKKPHFIDVNFDLADENLNLKKNLTTDGLHPDAAAKKIIGTKVNTYLKNLT